VEAVSREDVFTLSSSGAIGPVAIAGSVNAAVVKHEHQGPYRRRLINQDQTGANSEQTVDVSAVDETSIFGAAVDLTLSSLAIGAGVDIGIVRNNTSAIIGPALRSTPPGRERALAFPR